MLEAVFGGIALGGVLALMIGPVFFLLINTSIKKGFKPAVYMALGVMLSDAVFIAVAFLGSTYIRNFNLQSFWVGLCAGVILIVFGLINLLKKNAAVDENPALPDDSKTYFIDTLKGFTMNSINPFALIFWIGVAGTVSVNDAFSHTHLLVFFSSALVAVLVTDLLKAYLASRLKKILTPIILLWMNRVTGIALILYGISTIYKMM